MSRPHPNFSPPPFEKPYEILNPEEYKTSVAQALENWADCYQNFQNLKATNPQQAFKNTSNQENAFTQATKKMHDFFEITDFSNPLDKGVEQLTNLLNDETFNKNSELALFLTYKLNINHFQKDPKLFTDPNFEEYKNLISPFIQQSLLNTLNIIEQPNLDEVDLQTVRNCLENLTVCQSIDIAIQTIQNPELTADAKLTLAVQTMNVNGVVNTIQQLLPLAESNPQIKQLVQTIQGNTSNEVMTSLTGVYTAIEFQNYALNNVELTNNESVMVQGFINNYAQTHNKNPYDVQILDIGAGTGRHSQPLFESGYNVTALEYETKHVKYIKAQNANLNVIEGDWHNMPFASANKLTAEGGDSDAAKGFEIAYCLGRTILHNNTPQKMLRFFDEAQRVLNPDGELIIDIPHTTNIDTTSLSNDEYKKNIAEYQTHLQSLGVMPQAAQNIYDGPDKEHMFNRMGMTYEQLQSYGLLMGFEVQKLDEVPMGNNESSFTNVYYKLKKIPDFDIQQVPINKINRAIMEVGLYHPGVDYNLSIAAWGDIPLGAPLLHANTFNNQTLQELKTEGAIRTQISNGQMMFST